MNLQARAELLLVLVVGFAWLYVFPYQEQTNNPNENVRVYMTRAIVDSGSYAIGYRKLSKSGASIDFGSVTKDWGYVNDRSLYCTDRSQRPPDCAGALYSAKAPGTSLLGVPFYWAQKKLYAALGKPLTLDAVIAWLRLWTMLLPWLVFLVAFQRRVLADTRDLRLAVAFTGLLAFGTTTTTYASMFASHLHTGMALCAGLWLAERALADRTRRPLWLFLAGLALGWAQTSEYAAVVGLVPVGLLLLWRLPDRRDVAWAVLGGLLPLLLLFHYHRTCFGAVWLTGQSCIEPESFQDAIAPGVMGVVGPSWRRFVGVAFSPFTGLFFFAPFLVLWLAAAPLLLADAEHRRAAWPGVAVAVGFLLFFTSHSLWRGGWTAGPRYLSPAEPFLVLGLARFTASTRWGTDWRWRSVLVGLALVALWNRTLVHLTTQGYPFEFFDPLYEFSLPLLADGYVFRNLANAVGFYGLGTALPYVAAVVLLVVPALWSLLPPSSGPRRAGPDGRLVRVGAVLLVLATAVGMATFEASFAKAPTVKMAESLAGFRAAWRPEAQGEPTRDVARVRRLQGSKRSRSDWVDWVNGQTLLGRPRPLPASANAAFAATPDEPLGPAVEPFLEPAEDAIDDVMPAEVHDGGPDAPAPIQPPTDERPIDPAGDRK